MRKLLALSLTLAFVAVAAAGNQAIARPQKSVKVADDFFVRDSGSPKITISKGTKVNFKWKKGSSLHNVHAVSGPRTFTSSFRRKGTFSKIFSKKGTYKIVCDIHQPDMKLTIKVK
jgi:plastocyanin